MSTTRPRPSQSLPPPVPRERPLDVNEISKHLSMLENRWNGLLDGSNSNNDDDDDDAQSDATVTDATGTTTTGDGMDTPRASESQSQDGEDEYDDGVHDEIVSRVIANLQAKIDAVKRHKRVAAEVAALRKLLAEKEKDLMECERVLALEIGQVEG